MGMEWVHPNSKDKNWAWSDLNLLQKVKTKEESHTMTGLLYSFILPFLIIGYALYVIESYRTAPYGTSSDTKLVPILDSPIMLSLICRAPRGCIISSRYIKTGIGEKCASAKGLGPDDTTTECKFAKFGQTVRVWMCYDPIPKDGLNIFWNNTVLSGSEIDTAKAEAAKTNMDGFFKDYKSGMKNSDFGSSIVTKWFEVPEDGTQPKEMSRELPLSEGTYGVSYSKMLYSSTTLEGFYPSLISNQGYFHSWAAVTDKADNADYIDASMCKAAISQYPGFPAHFLKGAFNTNLGPKSNLRFQKIRVSPQFIETTIHDKNWLDVLGVIGGGFNIAFGVGALFVTVHLHIASCCHSGQQTDDDGTLKADSVQVHMDDAPGSHGGSHGGGAPSEPSDSSEVPQVGPTDEDRVRTSGQGGFQ